MKNCKNILLIIILSLSIFSCKKEEELTDSIIDASTPNLTKLDEWIRANYTYPFNIEVKYRFDGTEVDRNKVLVAPDSAAVQPFLTAMKRLWIDPYLKNSGDFFVKNYIPKQLVLIGSENYNSDGTITLGQAESGRKIIMYGVNNFSTKVNPEISMKENQKQLKSKFHTMHHEFAHILHQNIPYSEEYQTITKGYTSNWYHIEVDDALRQGFITPYGMSEPNEDFVEMIATILTNTKTDFDYIISKNYIVQQQTLTQINKALDLLYEAKAKETDATKKERMTKDIADIKDLIIKETAKLETYKQGYLNLRKKEKIIVDYFKQSWNTDIYALQKEIDTQSLQLLLGK